LQARIVGGNLQPHHRVVRHLLKNFRRQHGALLLKALPAVLVEQIGSQRLTLNHLDHALLHFVVQDADFVLQVLLHHLELFSLDGLGSIVLLDPLAREDLHADDDALDARGQMSDASRTSPAFSPKIARSSFSSGVSCVSPFGVTLPTRIEPCLTCAPMRMMPLSSRSRSAASPTFGMSRVISSGPSLVSRASVSSSSM